MLLFVYCYAFKYHSVLVIYYYGFLGLLKVVVLVSYCLYLLSYYSFYVCMYMLRSNHGSQGCCSAVAV